MKDVEAVYRAYVLWEAKPLTSVEKDPLYPKNEDAFCITHKCKRTDILGFTSRETFADDVLSQTLNWAKTKTPQLIQDVYRQVMTTKSVADLERFLNLIHEFKRKDKDAKSGNQYNFINQGVSEERYERIIEREAKRLANSSEEFPS